MAAIGHKALMIAFAFVVAQARADQASDARSQLEVIATALTTGNPAQAMTPFDKSYANYDKLSNYFSGLTGAFQIVNEIDVSDEEDKATETKLTVSWTLTLSDLGTNYTQQRRDDISVRLVLKDRKWKIVDFAPIAIFDPQPKPAPAEK
jgi:hypothetical protein